MSLVDEETLSDSSLLTCMQGLSQHSRLQNPQSRLSYQDGDELVDGEDAERLLGGDGQHLAQVVQRAQLRRLVVRLPQRHQDALQFVCGINSSTGGDARIQGACMCCAVIVASKR